MKKQKTPYLNVCLCLVDHSFSDLAISDFMGRFDQFSWRRCHVG